MSASKLLLGVLACHRRAQHLQACRDTWGKDVIGFDYKFFFGQGSHENEQPDELILDSPDDYRGLSVKVQAAVRWALEHDYTSYFKIDDDVYIRPERLVKAAAEWANYDFVGRRQGATDRYHEHAYCSGGCGYYLSKRAMEVLANAPTPNPEIAAEYAEDSWTGLRLLEAGIEAHNDDRLRRSAGSGPNRSPRPNNFNGWKSDTPTKYNDYISVCEFLGSEMIQLPHREWLMSNDAHSTVMGRLRLR